MTDHRKTPPNKTTPAGSSAVSPITGRDFPFYNGVPVLISGGRWLVVVGACVVGFLVLVLVPIPGLPGQWIKAILFPAIPLAALAWAAPKGWTAVFRRIRLRDVGWMLGFAVLNIIVSLAVATPISRAFGAEANPVGGILEDLSPAGRVSFYLSTAPQLLGEEVVTILPLLALLFVLTATFGWSRRSAILVSWIVTAIAFGAMHLPTYNWNFVQCFVIIGVARLVLTGAYLVTKNLWVSTGAHIINDWTLFTITLLVPATAFIA